MIMHGGSIPDYQPNLFARDNDHTVFPLTRSLLTSVFLRMSCGVCLIPGQKACKNLNEIEGRHMSATS